MATLTRQRTETQRAAVTPLSSTIPAPFPREQYLQSQQNNVILEQIEQPQARPSCTAETEAEVIQDSNPPGALVSEEIISF